MAYGVGMEFEWDEAKNSACFERRGFDFAYAVRAFLDPHRTVRGSAARIISARKANRKEVADYEHDAHQD